LKTRNGIIALPTDVDVIAGARDERPIAPADGPRVAGRKRVDVGAVVRVEGVVAPARDEATLRGYRGASSSWRMVAGPHGRVRVGAEVTPAPNAAGGARRALSAAATAAVLVALVMTAGAQAALSMARSRAGPSGLPTRTRRQCGAWPTRWARVGAT
jgi:hypothetical protein